MGSLVKFAGQPYAGNPHVRLEEGAPVGTPWRDTQALPTERGSPGYGPSYSSTRPGPTLQLLFEGSVDYTTELVAMRTTYTLTPRMFTAALLQFNSGTDSLGMNIRFRWEYQPGSELFVAYSDERDTLTPRFPTLENRAFVIKMTRLFRF